MNVGDAIYEYNREYRDNNGRDDLPLNWRKRRVTSETKVSWVVDGRCNDIKIPKKDFGDDVGYIEIYRNTMTYYAKTLDDIGRLEFIWKNKYSLSEKVRQCNDYGKLREIQRILEE